MLSAIPIVIRGTALQRTPELCMAWTARPPLNRTIGVRPGTRTLKLAEACASRTHRRHQRCRPPVLKTGTDTGLLTLPFRDQSMLMRAAEGEDGPTEGAWVSAAQAPWQYTARTDEFDTARPHSIKKGLSTDIVQPQGHAGLPSGRARWSGRGL